MIKRLIFLLFGFLISMNIQAQAIIGASGNCVVDTDPNLISSLDVQDIRYDCMKVFREATRQWYYYDASKAIGSRWLLDNQAGDGVTILGDGRDNPFSVDTLTKIVTIGALLDTLQVFRDSLSGLGSSEVYPDSNTVIGSGTLVDPIRVDTLNAIPTKKYIKQSFNSIKHLRSEVQYTGALPGDRVRIAQSDSEYRVESFAKYPVDTILTIPLQNPGWENLFSRSDYFGDESVASSWNDLGTLYIRYPNDTIHPETGLNTATGFEKTISALNQIAYNDPDFNTGIYQPDSTYTISFWCRKGKRPQDANVTLSVVMDYSGNPDITQSVSITDEWQHFNLVFTAFDVSRTFTWFSFRWTGDIGDKIYFADVQLNKGVYTGDVHYSTGSSTVPLEATDPIYANYNIKNGVINYEDVRGVKGTDAKSLNYLSSICQSAAGCGAIEFHKPLYLDETVLVREHVGIRGDFKSDILTGSGNNNLQSARIYADFNNDSEPIFQSIGTPQVGGIELGGFTIDVLSPAKCIWESADDLGARIHDISCLTGANNLSYGYVLKAGSLECQLKDIRHSGTPVGVYGHSSNTVISQVSFLNGEKGFDLKSGAWTISECWVEDMTERGIEFSGTRLTVNDLYAEHVVQNTSSNGYTILVNKADFALIQGCNLHQEPGVNNTNHTIKLDTVATAFITNNKFISTGKYYITTTDQCQSAFVAANQTSSVIIPNDFEGIADSSKVTVFRQTGTNWVPKGEFVGASIRDSWLRSANDVNTTEGLLEVRNDTINLVGPQNLFTHSENIVEGLAVGQRWLLGGGSTGVIQSNFEGSAELIIKGNDTYLRAQNFTDNGIGKALYPYVLSYRAKLPTATSSMNITPALDISGLGDSVGSTDTITTDWATYYHYFTSPVDPAFTINFYLDGDSVLFTQPHIKEGYLAGNYVQTTIVPIFNTEVHMAGLLSLDTIRLPNIQSAQLLATNPYGEIIAGSTSGYQNLPVTTVMDSIDIISQVSNSLMGWWWDGSRIWRNTPGTMSLNTSSAPRAGSIVLINGGGLDVGNSSTGYYGLHNGVSFDTALGRTAAGSGLKLGTGGWDMISMASRVVVGSETLKATASLELSATDKAFYPNAMTTAQRDAVTWQAGAVIYNTTTSKHQGYDGTTWNDFY